MAELMRLVAISSSLCRCINIASLVVNVSATCLSGGLAQALSPTVTSVLSVLSPPTTTAPGNTRQGGNVPVTTAPSTGTPAAGGGTGSGTGSGTGGGSGGGSTGGGTGSGVTKRRFRR